MGTLGDVFLESMVNKELSRWRFRQVGPKSWTALSPKGGSLFLNVSQEEEAKKAVREQLLSDGKKGITTAIGH